MPLVPGVDVRSLERGEQDAYGVKPAEQAARAWARLTAVCAGHLHGAGRARRDAPSASRRTYLGRGQVRWRRYGAVMTSGTAALSDVRHTEPEAIGNLAAVLKLCAAGKLRCSEKTRRPSAATIRTVAEALVAGDFYPRRGHRLLRLAVLLQAGGLARLEGSRLTLPEGPQGHRPTRPRVGPWAVGPTRPRVGPWAVGTLAAARPDRRVQPGGADQGPEVRRGAERSRAAPPGRGCRAGPLPGGRVDWCGRLVRPRCAAPT